METFNSFTDLFLDVWNNGVFGINATDIIVSLVIFLLFYLLRRLIARFILSRLTRIFKPLSVQSTKGFEIFDSKFFITNENGIIN